MTSSLPKCFDVLNADYFANLSDALHATGDPAAAQALIHEVYADISMLQSTLASQVAQLAPMAALMNAPTDLSSVLSWVNNLITNLIGPYAAAYVKLVQQVAHVTQAVANLEADIHLLESTKFGGVPFDIPPITIGCQI